MIDAFLDPYALARPSDSAQEDIVRNYFRSLLDWRNVGEFCWITLYRTRSLGETLTSSDGFPPWKWVQDSIEKFGIKDVFPHDVFTILSHLIERLPVLEDTLGINEVLFDEAVCTPVEYQTREQVFLAEFERLMVLVGLWARVRPHAKRYLVTRGLPSCPGVINFAAVLLDTDPPPEALNIQCPYPVQVEAESYQCATRIRLGADPEEIWASATNERAYHAALDVAARQLATATRATNLPAWRVGRVFIASVRALNMTSRANAKALLRACAETILSQNMGGTHALRVDRGPNSDQRRRGNDRAWRRDIDHEYHLHYWSTSSGPELACVVHHNDFDIPD